MEVHQTFVEYYIIDFFNIKFNSPNLNKINYFYRRYKDINYTLYLLLHLINTHNDFVMIKIILIVQ